MTTFQPEARSSSKVLFRSWLILAATLLAVLGSATPVRATDVEINDAARIHFQEGVRFLESNADDRFLNAYEQFTAAYEQSPSWKILSNLGIVAHALERHGEAIDAFNSYLREGGAGVSPEERRQIERDLKLLELRTATLVISTKPANGWVIDERQRDSGSSITNRYPFGGGELNLRVAAGVHTLSFQSRDHEPFTWNVTVKAGQTIAHSAVLLTADHSSSELPPARVAREIPDQEADTRSSSASSVSITPYLLTGIGAVLLGGSAWAIAQAADYDDRADDKYGQCLAEGNGLCISRTPTQLDLARLDDKTERFLWSGVGAATLGAAVAGTAIWLFLSGPTPPEEAKLTGVWLTGDGVVARGEF